jgi:phosphohistidine phosphatase
MKIKPEFWYKQSAVIPFRFFNGILQILIISTRKRKNWTIPKGIIEIGLSGKKSAAKEAFEEAGVKGELLTKKVGTYSYKKWRDICNVNVYGLEVNAILNNWEEDFRDRKWIEIRELEKYISNIDLLNIIKKFATKIYKEYNRCSL